MLFQLLLVILRPNGEGRSQSMHTHKSQNNWLNICNLCTRNCVALHTGAWVVFTQVPEVFSCVMGLFLGKQIDHTSLSCQSALSFQSEKIQVRQYVLIAFFFRKAIGELFLKILFEATADMCRSSGWSHMTSPLRCCHIKVLSSCWGCHMGAFWAKLYGLMPMMTALSCDVITLGTLCGVQPPSGKVI